MFVYVLLKRMYDIFVYLSSPQDLARSESRARKGIVDFPKIWTGHLKPLPLSIADRSRPY